VAIVVVVGLNVVAALGQRRRLLAQIKQATDVREVPGS
jgi:heme exporter protein D